MFKFLKEKLQAAVSKLTRKVDEEAETIKEPVNEEDVSKAIETVKLKEEKIDLPKKTEQKPDKVLEKVKEFKAESVKIKDHIKEKKVEEKIPLKKHTPEIAKKPAHFVHEKTIKRELPEDIPKKAVPVEEPVREIPKVEKTVEIEKKVEKPIEPEKKGFFSKIFGKKEEKRLVPEILEEKVPLTEIQEGEEKILLEEKELTDVEPVEATTEVSEAELEKPIEIEEEPAKKGFFGKISDAFTKKVISEQKFEELFWDLEVILLENNVAVEVIDKIKDDLKVSLVGRPIPRNQIDKTIEHSLNKSISELFDVEKVDLLKKIKQKKPYIIVFVGINGSGKTTTIAKMAHMFQKNHLSCVLAASDTFRAAAIDQLQLHADKLGIKLIKHDYGSDPAAVAFDAIKYAEARNKDVVLIDTAGRLHSNVNLMDEMKKIVRVAKPDMILFIGESITGNDCTEQAKKFNEAVGIDGIILSKADIDEKGGAAISVGFVTKKPILYIGVGQEYDDLKVFDKKIVLEGLGIA